MKDFATHLRRPNEAAWGALIDNPFVAAMADGSLPIENFRFYIEQNLQYLPQYARVLGLGVARSATDAQLARFAGSIGQIIDVEMDTNRRLRDATIELGAADRGGADGMAPACLGYTSYLLATAATGDSLDIMAAILPCAWSYHEIAARYPNPAAHPIYSDWIGFFGGEDYRTYLSGLLSQLDDVTGDVDDNTMGRLQTRFLNGARYERAFWQMGFNIERWPDQEATDR